MSFLVGIDAGHGLGNRSAGVYDPGAVYVDKATGLTYREADLTVFYSNLLGKFLEDAGYCVFKTRAKDDLEMRLSERVSKVRQAGCDALISLHTNAFSNPSASGCEVLYRDQEKDSKLASTLLAGVINSGLRIRSRGLKKRSNLSILKYEKPSALLELGFITNSSDRAKLCDLVKANKICSSIVSHIEMLGTFR